MQKHLVILSLILALLADKVKIEIVWKQGDRICWISDTFRHGRA